MVDAQQDFLKLREKVREFLKRISDDEAMKKKLREDPETTLFEAGIGFTSRENVHDYMFAGPAIMGAANSCDAGDSCVDCGETNHRRE